VALAAAGSFLPLSAEDLVPRAAVEGSQNTTIAPGAHREGEVIVAFRDGVDEAEMDRVLRSGRATGARRSRFGPRVLAQLDPGQNVAEAVDRFGAMPGVAC